MAGHMTEAPKSTRKRAEGRGLLPCAWGGRAQTDGSSYSFCKGQPSSLCCPAEMLCLKCMSAGGNTRG